MALTKEMSYREVLLSQVRHNLSARVGRSAMLDIRDPYALSSDVAMLLEIQAELFVWSETVEKESRTIFHPATCWQHLKQRFFLPDGWVRTKWPVRMASETISFEVKAMYPEFRRAVLKGQMSMRLFVNADECWGVAG